MTTTATCSRRSRAPSTRCYTSGTPSNDLIDAVVTDGSGTHHTDYRYDADGIRVSQTADGQETRYLVDTVRPYPQVLLEYRPSGLAVVSYVYGNGLIEQNRGGVLSYYHVDGLGSTRALTNASGVVTDRYVYDANGRILAQTGSTSTRTCSRDEQRDPRLGLDYLRARYFQPSTGRFLGRDPLSGILTLPITQHPYAYAGDNPVNLTDPTGRQFDLGGLSAAVSVESILCSISFITLPLRRPHHHRDPRGHGAGIRGAKPGD